MEGIGNVRSTGVGSHAVWNSLVNLLLAGRYLGDGSHPSKAFASTSFEGQIGSILKKKQTRDNSADGPISSTRNDTDAVSLSFT